VKGQADNWTEELPLKIRTAKNKLLNELLIIERLVYSYQLDG